MNDSLPELIMTAMLLLFFAFVIWVAVVYRGER